MLRAHEFVQIAGKYFNESPWGGTDSIEEAAHMGVAICAVLGNGGRFEYEYDFQYGALNKKPTERADNLILFFLQTITAPARLAGQVLLVPPDEDGDR